MIRPPRHVTLPHAPLIGVLAFYVVAYASLAATGNLFFIYKSLIVPAFLCYGLLCREPRAFARDWLPFLSVTVLFDSLRGGIYRLVEAGYRDPLEEYVIEAERWMFGHPALGAAWQARIGGPLADGVATAVHGTHFLFFLLFGLIAWHLNRAAFHHFRRTLALVMFAGLVGYLVWPTVPPWLAAANHSLPEVRHVIRTTYVAYVPELYGAFDTNPVAAMPSLHAAFPTACLVSAGLWFGRLPAALTAAYAACVWLAVVYLGEHYAVDVVAGVVLALVCAAAAWRWGHVAEPPVDGRRWLIVSLASVMMAGAIALLP